MPTDRIGVIIAVVALTLPSCLLSAEAPLMPVTDPVYRPTLVNDDQEGGGIPQFDPAIATNSSGQSVLVWYDPRGGDYGIWAQHFSDMAGSRYFSNTRITDPAAAVSPYLGTPSVAITESGRFAVAWEDHRNGHGDIYARLFDDMDRPVGDPFQVSIREAAGDADDRMYPDITFADRHGFVIAWCTSSRDAIWARRFTNDGRPIGASFRVDDVAPSRGTGRRETPSIAMDSTGGFMVAWEDERGVLYPARNIYAQSYSASGAPVGSNFRVNDNPNSTFHQYADVVAVGAGKFVIAWKDLNCYARYFDAGGSPLAPSFRLNDQPVADFPPHIAASKSGTIVAVWSAEPMDASALVRCFNDFGVALTGELRVDDWEFGSSMPHPVVGCDGHGDFMVAWHASRYQTYNDVFMQLFDHLGTPQLGNTRVNDDFGATAQLHPAISAAPGRAWTIVWQDQRDGERENNIYIQQFDSVGSPTGRNARVNDDSTTGYDLQRDQEWPDVAFSKSGITVVVWQDRRNNTNGDIFAQRFDKSARPIGGNFMVSEDSSTGMSIFPKVFITPQGGFLVSWRGFAANYYRLFDSSGTPAGPSLQSSTGSILAVSPGDDGGFVAVEQLGASLKLRHFDPWGQATGPEVPVGGAWIGAQSFRCLERDSAQNIGVVWKDDVGIYVQWFSTALSPLNAPQNIPMEEPGTNSLISLDPARRIVHTWLETQGSESRLFVEWFCPDGERMGTPLPIMASGTPEERLFCDIAFDGGRAGAAWQDSRRGDKGWDIFAGFLAAPASCMEALADRQPSACVCRHHGDGSGDGLIDANDIAIAIDVVYFGAEDANDSECPISRTDFDGFGGADATDLAFLIDHVFFGGGGPIDPCGN